MIGGADPFDFFRFTLQRRSSFNLILKPLKANADIALLNKRGKVLIQSRKPGKQSETIATVLDEGVYYLRITPRSRPDSTRYTLTLSAGNTAPSLVNTGFSLQAGAIVTIQSNSLKASDAEQASDQIVYTLTSLPQNGSLFLNGVTLR